MNCCKIEWILFLVLGLYCTGANGNISVIDGNVDEHTFECNSKVTIRCHISQTINSIQWSIGNTSSLRPDADCFPFSCTPSSHFPSRYDYIYSHSTGVSDLRITNASFDDDQMTYQCSDDSFKYTFRLNTTSIQAHPTNESTKVHITSTTHDVTVNLTTGCIYPVHDISLKWYSTPLKGSDAVEHVSSDKHVHCSPVLNCERANTSIESLLVIKTSQTGQEREYYANISYGRGTKYFLKPVGKYNVTTDTTTIPTTSASSLPSSSIAIFTTSSSTWTGKEQNQNTDKTSTILIIAFSSLCGIALLLIVVFAINKIRKRYKKQSGASNDHEM